MRWQAGYGSARLALVEAASRLLLQSLIGYCACAAFARGLGGTCAISTQKSLPLTSIYLYYL
jgi:hypothetical protein